MAVKKNRLAQNVPGKFYVDDQCIACDACVVEAPLFFSMNDIKGHAYVKMQPTTAEQIQLANEALKHCPVDAIGDDGYNTNSTN